jgi:hypothetical protein
VRGKRILCCGKLPFYWLRLDDIRTDQEQGLLFGYLKRGHHKAPSSIQFCTRKKFLRLTF